MPSSESSESSNSAVEEDNGCVMTEREVCINGIRMKTAEVEAKLDAGNFQDAETSLREGLSLNSEEARVLLGKLEFQRGNVKGAFKIFEGIDLQAMIDNLQPRSFPTKAPSRRGRSRTESILPTVLSANSLILEGMLFKLKCLQKLGRIKEAAQDCKNMLDSVERIFSNGITEAAVDKKLQETVSQAVELLPKLWRQIGFNKEAVAAYRHALLTQWSLDNDCFARIQKGFAIFLLYSGFEAGIPSPAVPVDGLYIPKNNLEEAILLLMVLMRKFYLGKIKWDPSIMEHLTFALSVCSQTSLLAKEYEELVPGVIHRIDRWKALAFCHTGAEQNSTALNLLRKSLHKHERPDDVVMLLLAAKVCCNDPLLAAEGSGYARRAIANAQGLNGHLKGVAFRMLGLCLGKQAKVASSDFERSQLQSEALKFLDEAIVLEPYNPDLIFELGYLYAEQRNLPRALCYAKQFLDATGGSTVKGWRLLALTLSAQQRFSEAEVVIDAAIDETAKWDQGPLLRLKAKIKESRSLPMEAIETYRLLLALIQAHRKSFGPLGNALQEDDEKEFEVWQCLANLYSGLSYWKDAEICLDKARALRPYSADTLRTQGKKIKLLFHEDYISVFHVVHVFPFLVLMIT
ncbi:hypothetical protein RJ641_016916 [Dillenia turbinata]|uniref:Uncharacterized protein n=1 Tax=Dillenia turbinata TaxID=194707 RepID=A0AAN8YX78_9MAGN